MSSAVNENDHVEPESDPVTSRVSYRKTAVDWLVSRPVTAKVSGDPGVNEEPPTVIMSKLRR